MEAAGAWVGGEVGRPTIVGLTAASSAPRLHASEHLDYLGTLLGYIPTHTHTQIYALTFSHTYIHTHCLWLVNISCCHSVLSVRKHQAELSMFLSKMFTRNYNVDPFISFAVGRLKCRVYIISRCLHSSPIWSELTYWGLVLVQFCLLMKGV